MRRCDRLVKPKETTREEEEGAGPRGGEAKSSADDFTSITMRTRKRLEALKKPQFSYRSGSGGVRRGAGDVYGKDNDYEKDDVKPEFMDASKRREERRSIRMTTTAPGRNAGSTLNDQKPSLINSRHLSRSYSNFTGDEDNMEDNSTSEEEDDESFFGFSLKRVDSKDSNKSSDSDDIPPHPSLIEVRVGEE